MTKTLSIAWGLPFTNDAFTDEVLISPSLSTRNMPVTAPELAVDASKTLGFLNLNVAMPDDPSRARVSLMSGTTFSSRPRTNWISAAARSDVVSRADGVSSAADEVEKASTAVIMTAGMRTRKERRRPIFVLVCGKLDGRGIIYCVELQLSLGRKIMRRRVGRLGDFALCVTLFSWEWGPRRHGHAYVFGTCP